MSDIAGNDFELAGRVAMDTADFKKKMQTLGTQMQSIGKKLSIGLTAPIALGFVSAARNASLLEENLNKVKATFGGALGKSVEKFADTMAKSFGRSKVDILEMVGTFGNFLTSMGFAKTEAAGLSQNLTKIVADLASFHNVSDDEAFTKVLAGLAGEGEALRRWGVHVNATSIAQLALAEGMKKTYKEMTESEKVKLRLLQLERQSLGAKGDVLRSNNEYANSQRRLTGAYRDTSAELGKVFLPLVSKMMRGMAEALYVVKDMSPEMKKLTVGIAAAAAAIGPLLIALGAIVKLLPLLKAGMVVIAAGAAALASPFVIAAAAVTALGLGLSILYDENTAFKTWVDNMVSHLDRAIDKFKELIDNMMLAAGLYKGDKRQTGMGDIEHQSTLAMDDPDYKAKADKQRQTIAEARDAEASERTPAQRESNKKLIEARKKYLESYERLVDQEIRLRKEETEKTKEAQANQLDAVKMGVDGFTSNLNLLVSGIGQSGAQLAVTILSFLGNLATLGIGIAQKVGSLPSRAAGGMVQKGKSYTMGEGLGRETVTMGEKGYVTSNAELRRQEGGGGDTFNLDFGESFDESKIDVVFNKLMPKFITQVAEQSRRSPSYAAAITRGGR